MKRSKTRPFGRSARDLRRALRAPAPWAAPALWKWVPLPVAVTLLLGAQFGSGSATRREPGRRDVPQDVAACADAKWLRSQGVTLLWSDGQPMQQSELLAIREHLERLDRELRAYCLDRAPLVLLAGDNILAHPDYQEKRGEVPGRPGVLWSKVIGLAPADATIVLVNHHLRDHPGECLLFHEMAHQFDRRRGWLSDRREWRALHSRVHWPRDYPRRFPAEGFADAWSAFLCSPESRASLDPEVRAYLERQLRRRPESPAISPAESRVLFRLDGDQRVFPAREPIGLEAFTPDASPDANRCPPFGFRSARFRASNLLAIRDSRGQDHARFRLLTPLAVR